MTTLRVLVATLVLTVFAVMLATVTATNTVPGSNADQLVQSTGANQLKPADCAGLNLSTIVTGNGGTVNGTAGNDLILDGPSGDTLTGKGGNDCIVAGDGDDTINGNGGNDVCIGGPGTDTFKKCNTAIQ